LTVAEKTSAYRFLGARLAGLATIFTLHRVVRGGEIILDPALAVGEDFLDAAVGHVIAKGYKVVTVEELHRRMKIQLSPPHMVAFTFDDGYRDNAALAAPIFEKHKAPWSLYLTTGFPDRTCSYWWGALERALMDRNTFDLELGSWRRTYSVPSLSEKRKVYAKIVARTFAHRTELSRYLRERYAVDGRELLHDAALSWSDVRRIASSGLVEIGGHAVSHRPLTQLDVEETRRELQHCRSRIREMTGAEVRHFAYPHGAAGAREYSLAREAGYNTGVTAVASSVYAACDDHAYALPRIQLDGRTQSLSQLDLHLSGLTGLAALRTRHPLWRRLST
jgi:peptidoglycan/xylan/chitin deacetylase (PgdA/CDA1 family)